MEDICVMFYPLYYANGVGHATLLLINPLVINLKKMCGVHVDVYILRAKDINGFIATLNVCNMDYMVKKLSVKLRLNIIS